MKNLIVGKNVLRLVWRTLFVVLGLPILYALEPFIRVRIGYISNQRIGHMALGAEIFLRDMDQNSWPKRTVYFIVTWDPANQQLLNMIKRRHRIYQNRFLAHVFFSIRPILDRTRFHARVGWGQPDQTREAVGLLSRSSPALSFTEEEKERGRQLLESMGIGSDDWFVCLNVRDSAYLNEWRPQFTDHWKNTKHKNANVEHYLKAVEYITSLGGYVLRMGAVVEKPLPRTNNPRIIDYATEFRSDFGDIYLFANCRFVLGTNNGASAVSVIFNRPAAFADTTMPWVVPYRSQDLFITRLFKRKSDRELLRFSDVKDAGLCKRFVHHEIPQRCEELGWEIVENHEEEIFDLCKDMVASLEGVEPAPEVRALQKYYQEEFHDYFGPESGVGFIAPSFAVKHRHLIVPRDGEAPDRSQRPKKVS